MHNSDCGWLRTSQAWNGYWQVCIVFFAWWLCIRGRCRVGMYEAWDVEAIGAGNQDNSVGGCLGLHFERTHLAISSALAEVVGKRSPWLPLMWEAQLFLWNNGVPHGLDMDHSILKDKRIHPIWDASHFGIGSPFEEEDILNIDCFDVPLCLRDCVYKISEETAYSARSCHVEHLMGWRGTSFQYSPSGFHQDLQHPGSGHGERRPLLAFVSIDQIVSWLNFLSFSLWKLEQRYGFQST